LFGLERVRYFPRQLITADDMTTEQEYLRQRDRRHNRFLHGWGVTCGLGVEPAPTQEKPWQVRVCPGYAIGPQGDEISLAQPVLIDLASGVCDDHAPCQPWPCPPSTSGSYGAPGGGGTYAGGQRKALPLLIAIRHAECDSKPVRVHPLGCGCDETLCEYSRIRDDVEVRVLCDLPKSHETYLVQMMQWAQAFAQWMEGKPRGPMPVPSCPQCPDDPWVVLAAATLPSKPDEALSEANLDFKIRPVLYSTQMLQFATLVLAKG
jgi:hypothetical protein